MEKLRQKKTGRTLLLVCVVCFISVFTLNVYSQSNGIVTNKIIIGAIRWDAWCGDLNKVGLEVERTLGPEQYHYRAPFYSKVIGKDSIQCRCTTQEIMDQEISYAKNAGIGYWAFCWYPVGSGLDKARALYLSSQRKADVNWCLILGTSVFDFDRDATWLVEQFKTSNYQKVMNGRPLVYIWNDAVTLAELSQLRLLNSKAGNAELYVVVMDEEAAKAAKYAATLKADATSAYITWASNNGGNYAPLVPQAERNRWEEHKAMGIPVVPWVTTGRDTKPRIDHPVSWTSVAPEQWTKDASPAEIAAHLKEALDWMKNNAHATPAHTLIIYAWNEFDEGGWICPTLGPNTSRLDAIKKVLKPD